MPGILPLLENAVLDHRAPIVGVKDHERVTDWAIGQVDGARAGWHPIVPAAYDDRVDGLSLVVASMRVLCLLWFPIAVIRRQFLNSHQFGAQALLRRCFATPMAHDPLAHVNSLPLG